jgi:hypothetical protein
VVTTYVNYVKSGGIEVGMSELGAGETKEQLLQRLGARQVGDREYRTQEEAAAELRRWRALFPLA